MAIEKVEELFLNILNTYGVENMNTANRKFLLALANGDFEFMLKFGLIDGYVKWQ